MTPDDWSLVKELFEAALPRSGPDRATFLDAASVGRLEIRQAVEALLASHEKAGTFLSQPLLANVAENISEVEALLASPAGAVPADSWIGRRVGRYRLVAEIGRGGMGAVFRACRDDDQFHKEVAIKIIGTLILGPETLRRFLDERQILATFDHPNIVRLLDGGVTEDGLPYIVMDHISGLPITEHCDKMRLGVRERLELLRTVCLAVQYAHQRLVIHRDIKPGNILVTADGTPVLLDFGIAKILDPLASAAGATRAFPMTPAYASPEQLRGSAATTATDVYSLGVVMYELLTGMSRYLAKTPFDEGIRIVEEEPIRPSARILSEVSPVSARNRRTERTALARQLKGDLDRITMKALENDRTRRYESASELAAEIRRYLRNEPVIASSPSTGYRVRKFARRHRLGVSVAAITVVLLIAFAWAMTLQARRIASERDRATREAQVSQRITDFLTLLFSVPDPNTAHGNVITARELLDTGSRQIDASLSGQPEVQGRLMETIGVTYTNLGLYAPALDQLQRALEIQRRVLGPEHPDTLRSMCAVARVYELQTKWQPAEELYQQAVDIQRRVLGPEHPDRLDALQHLGWLIARQDRFSEGEKLVRGTVDTERRVLGVENPATLRGMTLLGDVLGFQHRWPEVEEVAGQALAIEQRVLDRDDPRTQTTRNLLAGTLDNDGKHREAEKVLREALNIDRRVLGSNNPVAAGRMGTLATVLTNEKQFSEAEKLFEEALQIYRRTVGPENGNTFATMNNLALLYWHEGRNQEAEKIFSEMAESFRRTLGPEHLNTLIVMTNLGLVYGSERRYDDAEKLLSQTIALKSRALGEHHPATADSFYALASVVVRRGQRKRALDILQQAVNSYRSSERLSDPIWQTFHGDPRYEALAVESHKP
jgi:serine/threonine protein kinase/Tfp pilus assembly protein PilF